MLPLNKTKLEKEEILNKVRERVQSVHY